MTLLVQARTRRAAPDEVEAALAGLDAAAGVYFGCDAGVAGLHPLQATLLAAPALSFTVWEDGASVQALNPLGRALLQHAALAPCLALAGRGAGRSAVAVARAFMAAFGGAPEALLLGALGFEAHRLANPSSVATAAPVALGVLFFGDRYWQRDADGAWTYVALSFDGLPQVAGVARPPAEPHAAVIGETASLPVHDDFPPGGYAEVVARAVQVLRAQPLVSLTLSQSFRRKTTALASAAFARLRQVNPAPATFFVNTGEGERLFGASPDLQLVLRGRDIQALPVCGTVARGAGAVGEAESFRELVNEDVDAASLAVCSDALGNDLAPLCEPGSLRLSDRRRPMSLSTVVHTVDRLQGRLREGVDAWDAIVVTAAPVMLTGTPRALALAAITQLEAGPRGWYGGMMVRVAGDGSALVGTILRAAALRNGMAEVRTGGDLMADSDPPREERESRLKAISLWRALGLPVEPAAGAPGLSAGDVPAAAPGDAAPMAATARLPAAVALCDGGDPFPAAVAQALRGLGLALDADAGLRVLIGADEAACRHALAAASAVSATGTTGTTGVVAIGDAAVRVLGLSGFAAESIQPEHGRLLRCQRTPQAPLPQDVRSFLTARYATWAVRTAGDGVPPGWQVWAHDSAGNPVALAHTRQRLVCLLFRPDSLLSDDTARAVLRAALAFAAQPPQA